MEVIGLAPPLHQAGQLYAGSGLPSWLHDTDPDQRVRRVIAHRLFSLLMIYYIYILYLHVAILFII